MTQEQLDKLSYNYTEGVDCSYDPISETTFYEKDGVNSAYQAGFRKALELVLNHPVLAGGTYAVLNDEFGDLM